jgi:hypothetical protein
MSVDLRLIAMRPTATGCRYNLRPPKSGREISGLAAILFTLQGKCGIGVPPMVKTNMAGTAMPLK